MKRRHLNPNMYSVGDFMAKMFHCNMYAHQTSDDNILIFHPPGTAFIKPRALIQRVTTVAPSTGEKAVIAEHPS